MKTRICVAILLLVGAGAPAAWPQANPTRPAGPDMPISNPASAPQEKPQLAPDTRPLSGVQELTLGTPQEKRYELIPQLSVSEMVDNNPILRPGTETTWQYITIVSGSLDLHRRSQTQDLRLTYVGTGLIYPQNSAFNTHSQSLAIAESISLRRWDLLFSDQVSYSPESTFGYGLGGFGGFGPTGGGLNPNYVPNQSILAGQLLSRIDNVAMGQLTYRATARSSINIAASYGLLHFVDSSQALDNNQINTTMGYDNRFTARDTIGLSYSHVFYRYNQSGVEDFDTHSANVSYARRMTGRLSLRLSGGPQVYRINAMGPLAEHVRVSYNAQGSTLYRRGRTDLEASLSRMVTGGGGFYAGAVTSQAAATAQRTFGRVWQMHITGGVARNQGIIGNTNLNTVYGGGGVRRSLGRSAGMFFSYNLQRQTGTAICVGLAACETGPLRHVVGMGLDWNVRPIRLE